MIFTFNFYCYHSSVSPDKEKIFCSPVADPLFNVPDLPPCSHSKCSSDSSELVLYIPEMEEIRISPIVAHKGFLNVLEQKSNGWKKRWVVSVILEVIF